MKDLEKFLKSNNLDEFDSLLELSDIVREFIELENYEQVENIINYSLDNNYYEAFSWIVLILQEEMGKNKNISKEVLCDLGKSINKFDKFIDCLGVEQNSLNLDLKNIYDKNGELNSTVYTSIYKTKIQDVYLITSENFDTKDNDYIEYKLLFSTKDRNKKVETLEDFER